MPATIKIYPPNPLPDRNVTETQFSIWTEELEVYLSQEKDFAYFLPGGAYETWSSYENDRSRINDIKEEHRTIPGQVGRETITQIQADARNDEFLQKLRHNLRTVLSIIGKCVSQGHYATVTKHSTSIQWIYDTLRSDYDIKQRGIHFFNLLDLKFDGEKQTPVVFYNQYRTLISNNLGKAGDTIKYKNNTILESDEKLTPMLEDLILLNVLKEIDNRLPQLVKSHYNHKLRPEERLMDVKSDITIVMYTFSKCLKDRYKETS